MAAYCVRPGTQMNVQWYTEKKNLIKIVHLTKDFYWKMEKNQFLKITILNKAN